MTEILEPLVGHNNATIKSGYIEQFDPRLRLSVVFLLAFSISLMNNVVVLSVFLVMGLMSCLLSAVRLQVVFWRLLTMDTFIILLLMTLPFTTPLASENDLWFTLSLTNEWILQANSQGFWLAIVIFLKANATMLFLQAFVGSMNISQLSRGLAALKMPEKLLFLLVFTLRYLSVIHWQYKRMRNAMKARAFQAKSNWHTWRTFGYLIAMLLVRSLDRSERIHQAMKCRGFVGKLYLLPNLKWQSRDTLMMVFAAVLVLTLFGVDRYWVAS